MQGHAKPHIEFFEGRWWYSVPADVRTAPEVLTKLRAFTARLNAKRRTRDKATGPE